mgnify:FL=1
MKKTKKIIITIVTLVVVAVAGIFVFYNYFYDKNQLSISEKEWINTHKTNITSFNVPSDLNIFASTGKGVFYDFLDDLTKKYDLKINKNVVPISGSTGLGFVVNNKISDEDLLIYEDHYVVISKDYTTVKTFKDLSGKKIGALASIISRVSSSYTDSNSYTTYETKEALTKALTDGEVSYIIVPLTEYIDEVLYNKFNIVYHLDNFVNYYYIHLGNDKTLNSIITKHYNEWISNDYEKSYYNNTYRLFCEKLSISDVESDNLTNKIYNFGFVNQTPFNALNSSKYGGIIFAYLEEFSKFSKVDFTYTKYKTYSELINSFNNNKLDLIFDPSSLETKNSKLDTNIKEKFYIISPLTQNLSIVNLNEINNETIYVIKDSSLAKYLSDLSNIKVETVKNEKALIRKAKKNNLIALDAETFDYYRNDKIKNYQISYTGYTSANYSFKYINANDTFTKLFTNYINYLSQTKMTNNGMITYKAAESSGNLVGVIAKYILIITSVVIVIIGVYISSKKKIKLNTKIKKDEKLKFIDMLTSLKNRNYLNERISTWNQNTIYPQAIIVIDLNNIKYLNDTFGHEEGDRQIMAAANILHQTQQDNTEIMRTDGNEFMIYMVGYSEKQVLNYMKKLIKEFNTLPYDYGAAFGFSMIVDDLKLIDDAINEATIQMRENKELEASSDEKED